MKRISNIFKVLIVIFIMYQYHRLSGNGALSSDNCKGLLYIGISCFFVLCPVDASVFAKNVLLIRNGKAKSPQSEAPQVAKADDWTLSALAPPLTKEDKNEDA